MPHPGGGAGSEILGGPLTRKEATVKFVPACYDTEPTGRVRRHARRQNNIVDTAIGLCGRRPGHAHAPYADPAVVLLDANARSSRKYVCPPPHAGPGPEGARADAWIDLIERPPRSTALFGSGDGRWETGSAVVTLLVWASRWNSRRRAGGAGRRAKDKAAASARPAPPWRSRNYCRVMRPVTCSRRSRQGRRSRRR